MVRGSAFARGERLRRGAGNAQSQRLSEIPPPVSYTHLDVYKRQPDTSVLFSVDLPLTARLSEKILAGEGNRKCVKVWEISDFDLMLFEEDAAASRREESAE